jgi:L-malate glycosyltransferase
MKILIIPSWYPPQGGLFFQEQAEALALLGHEVTVVFTEYNSIKDFSKIDYSKINKQTINKVNVIRNHFVKLPKLFKFNQNRYIEKFIKLVEYYFSNHTKPDLIYAQSAVWGGYIGSLFSKKHNIPLIIQEQRGRFLDGNPYARELIEQWQLPYIQKAFESASEILLLTKKMQPTLERLAPGFKGNFHIIPNMVDTDFFSLKKKKTELKPFKFLCIARLDAYKGIDTLLQAFKKCLVAHPDILLEIVGAGEELELFKHLAEKLEINQKVSFSGMKDRNYIKEALHACHFFILATKFDTFPLVALEAVSTGTPIIGTDSGGLTDIIDDKNGYLCQVNDIDGISEAMKNAINNFDNFDSVHIRNEALKKYHPDVVSKQLNTIFNTYQ